MLVLLSAIHRKSAQTKQNETMQLAFLQIDLRFQEKMGKRGLGMLYSRKGSKDEFKAFIINIEYQSGTLR